MAVMKQRQPTSVILELPNHRLLKEVVTIASRQTTLNLLEVQHGSPLRGSNMPDRRRRITPYKKITQRWLFPLTHLLEANID
jgi:hypothetical protein